MTLREIRKQIDDLWKLRMQRARELWAETHPGWEGTISTGEFVRFLEEQERLGK
jgi:hypothetical protein